MEKKDVEADSNMPFNYYQASMPKTDDPTFDDNINSVRCGLYSETGKPITKVKLCYDHLTVTRFDVTGESDGDYRFTAECSWTGSEAWPDEQYELKQVDYSFISSVIIDYVQPVITNKDRPTTVFEERACNGRAVELPTN